MFLGKTYYNPALNKEATFQGFENIIYVYENGFKSYEDIRSERYDLAKLPNYVLKDDDNIYYRISNGYNIILQLINNGKITFDKEAVLKSIKKTNIDLQNKPYYSTGKGPDKVRICKYDNSLTKFINFIEKNEEHKINIDLIDNKLNKIGNALDIITSDNNLNILNIDRKYSHNLYMTYLQIYNLVKDMEHSEKQGKGLKIITPKQMLSRLPV